jgi:hypothetical protein
LNYFSSPGVETTTDDTESPGNDRIAVDCQDSTSVLRKWLRFACVDSCSVMNKIAVIIDHMVDSGIDIFTITETWLKECDSVSIAGLSTAGFVFRSFPRQSGRIWWRHGYSVQIIVGCKIQ